MVICFLTDFGLQDDFVGTCHGVIARIAPEARVIDVTHGIPATAVLQGALVLSSRHRWAAAGVMTALATLTWQPAFLVAGAAVLVAVLAQAQDPACPRGAGARGLRRGVAAGGAVRGALGHEVLPGRSRRAAARLSRSRRADSPASYPRTPGVP